MVYPKNSENYTRVPDLLIKVKFVAIDVTLQIYDGVFFISVFSILVLIQRL